MTWQIECNPLPLGRPIPPLVRFGLTTAFPDRREMLRNSVNALPMSTDEWTHGQIERIAVGTSKGRTVQRLGNRYRNSILIKPGKNGSVYLYRPGRSMPLTTVFHGC